MSLPGCYGTGRSARCAGAIYGHCRHTHIIRTMMFRATRNPSRSVIGCNLQAASREYVTVQGGLERAGARWLVTIRDDSPKRPS